MRKQTANAAVGDLDKASMMADSVETLAKEALRVAHTGREASDLILVARLVKRLKEDTFQAAKAELEKGTLAKAKELAKTGEQATLIRYTRQPNFFDALSGDVEAGASSFARAGSPMYTR